MLKATLILSVYNGSKERHLPKPVITRWICHKWNRLSFNNEVGKKKKPGAQSLSLPTQSLTAGRACSGKHVHTADMCSVCCELLKPGNHTFCCHSKLMECLPDYCFVFSVVCLVGQIHWPAECCIQSSWQLFLFLEVTNQSDNVILLYIIDCLKLSRVQVIFPDSNQL